MKLSDYVWKLVAAAGVRHVFMLPGGGCMHLVDSLARNPYLTYVACLHEQACAIAADAYGQVTGLGVALVTTGPGGTNALTGVAAAWLDSTPMLVISGQVKRADLKGERGVRQMGFQEIDIVEMARPITKYAVTVMDPASIRYHVEKALYLARHGRPGPVWLDIPLDVQAAQIDEAALDRFGLKESQPVAHPSAIAEAARLLAAAERPVVLVGNGVRLDNAIQQLHGLLDVLHAPVLTTWKAADLLADDHPLYCGRPGSVGQRGANFTIQNADVLLAIGARLDFGQIGYDYRTFARGAKKIIVDIDAAEIGKPTVMPVALGIHSGAGAFLAALAAAIGKPMEFPSWLARCQEWRQRYPVVTPGHRALTDGVSNYVLLDALSECMEPGDVLVPGSSGAASETTMQAFRVKTGQRILNSQGLGPMGFGIPAAIGACLASGGRRTVCIDGDGGFAMNLQELEVVRRLNLPIKFFVLENDGYGSIRQTQAAYFGGRFVASEPGSGLTLPDYESIADAIGIENCEIYDHEGLRAKVRRVLDCDGPVVCVVVVSPSQVTEPRLVSERRENGAMFSKPLEDLSPYLPREEFRGNMIVPPIEEPEPARSTSSAPADSRRALAGTHQAE